MLKVLKGIILRVLGQHRRHNIPFVTFAMFRPDICPFVVCLFAFTILSSHRPLTLSIKLDRGKKLISLSSQ